MNGDELAVKQSRDVGQVYQQVEELQKAMELFALYVKELEQQISDVLMPEVKTTNNVEEKQVEQELVPLARELKIINKALGHTIGRLDNIKSRVRL